MKQLQDANNTIKAQDKQIKQLQAGKLLQIFYCGTLCSILAALCQHLSFILSTI